jgi:uncharacterized RDD family membrane protein YckC
MRCPKCHYVSFDGQNRCRNCGYDLSLSQLAAADTIELPTNTESTATPLADLSLKSDPSAAGTDSPTLVDRYMPPQPTSAGSARAGTARAPARDTDPLDLPLFSPDAPRGHQRTGAPAAGPDALPSGNAQAQTAPMRVPGGSRVPQQDDRPLVSGQTPPRAPLSVRRRTGEVPKAGRVTPPAPVAPPKAEEPRLDLGLDATEPDLDDIDLGRPVQPRDVAASIAGSRAAASRTALPRETVARQATVREATPREALVPELPPARPAAVSAPAAATAPADVGIDHDIDEIDDQLAPLGTRILAGAIDVAFMLLVDAAVLYFTLRITGLPPAAWRRLPLAPLVGFLALLHGGYLTMFTAASGQTMGKMLTGTRVVSSQGGPVPFGSAVVRAVVWLLTIVPAGVGFIPAFLASDRRALHDRFAETKVIKTTE